MFCRYTKKNGNQKYGTQIIIQKKYKKYGTQIQKKYKKWYTNTNEIQKQMQNKMRTNAINNIN